MLTAKKLNQNGILNPLIIPLVVIGVVLVAASYLAVMYYGKYVNQRTNTQQIVASAVQAANTTQKAQLEADFAQREKFPTNTYTSPSALGSVVLQYPKTWSSYVVDNTTSMDFYAYPNFVPSTNVNYALRMSVVDEEFSEEMENYKSLITQGTLTSTSIEISGVQGVRLDGMLKQNQQGSMVVLPLRDSTLLVWTEDPLYEADFNNIILPGLSYSP